MLHDLELFLVDRISYFFVFADEKKKTKKVDNELNPVWNEVTALLFFNSLLKDKLCLVVPSLGWRLMLFFGRKSLCDTLIHSSSLLSLKDQSSSVMAWLVPIS